MTPVACPRPLAGEPNRTATTIRRGPGVLSVSGMTNNDLTSTSPVFRTAAGAAFLATPLALVGGMLTSPPQADASPRPPT